MVANVSSHNFCLVLMVIFALTGNVLAVAQPPENLPLVHAIESERDAYDAELWQTVSFEERQLKFGREERDSEWAPAMEKAIEHKVAEFDRPLMEVLGEDICSDIPLCREKMPSVLLLSVECRRTVCKINLRWPSGTARSVIGQQVSFLYELGIDHQGEMYSLDDENQYLVELIARRRT